MRARYSRVADVQAVRSKPTTSSPIGIEPALLQSTAVMVSVHCVQPPIQRYAGMLLAAIEVEGHHRVNILAFLTFLEMNYRAHALMQNGGVLQGLL